jgi:3-oxoacyl-[acyl-carrier protein] reductase
LAVELAADGIFSNIVIPELTLSEWVTDMFPPTVLEEYAQPFRREGLERQMMSPI